jgi:predicted nucleic acid-binding protein
VGTVVLDAGVVIGWLDASDAHHAAVAAALEERLADDLRLPASAWAEALVRQVRDDAIDLAREAVSEAAITIDPIDAAGAQAAARLRARHGSLRLPDALVIGHAEAIGADELLTTDARWKRFSKRVHVVA